jgi:hypothetical protein
MLIEPQIPNGPSADIAEENRSFQGRLSSMNEGETSYTSQ